MRFVSGLLSVTLFLAAGCGEPAKVTRTTNATSRKATTPASGAAADSSLKGSGTPAGDADDPALTAPAAVTDAGAPSKGAAVSDSGEVALSPQNTKLEFVGLHTNKAKPDPRTGTFEKFTGTLQVEKEAKALKSVSVEFDTTSLKTQIPKLTDHLKSADFFEVQQFPTAKFESTKVEAGEGGKVQITGSLTLHGETKEISFPATVDVTDDSVSLTSAFTIDRNDFKITHGPEQIEKDVSLTVVVGK